MSDDRLNKAEPWTEIDEARLVAAYSKGSEELADEAEAGYPPEDMVPNPTVAAIEAADKGLLGPYGHLLVARINHLQGVARTNFDLYHEAMEELRSARSAAEISTVEWNITCGKLAQSNADLISGLIARERRVRRICNETLTDYVDDGEPVLAQRILDELDKEN